MNVEQGTFTPLVFSANGGMATECLKFHKFVGEKIANKSGSRYEKVLSIIQCKLSSLILCASLMCLRGSRNFEIALDYRLGGDLLILDLKDRVRFLCQFIEVLCLFRAFVLFLATLQLHQTSFCSYTSTFPSVRFCIFILLVYFMTTPT